MASVALRGLSSELRRLTGLGSGGPSAGTGETGLIPLLCWGVAWIVIWLVLFQLAAYTHDRWTNCLPPSTKDHENDRHYNARTLIGTFHAIFVSAITIPAAFLLLGHQDDQFVYSDYLEWCSVDHLLVTDEQAELHSLYSAVALAGLAFTTFMIADVAFGLLHGFMTPDYMVHHTAFIAAGLVIRTNCMLPLNSSILLTMEASTPFLNYLLFMRHRGGGFKTSTSISGALFFFLFVFFRIGFNTYGAIYLFVHRDDWFDTVPAWQAWFLMIAVALGSAIQFFWLPQIVKVFSRALHGLITGAEVTDESVTSDTESAPEVSMKDNLIAE